MSLNDAERADSPQQAHDPDLYAKAKAGTEKEHAMTVRQAVRLYPKAIGWSMLISMICAMEGFSVAEINNFYSMPVFNKKYGSWTGDENGWQVSAHWQSSLSNGAQCAQIIGLLFNGWATDRWGYKPVILICLLWIAAVLPLFFCAPNIQALLAAEILCGLPWGVYQSIAINYAAEVVPVALRGYLTTFGNSCWGIGQLVAVAVIRSMLKRNDEWSYRIPYALQWMWIPPLFIGIALAPESPWWLVRKGRLDKARHSLLRLTRPNADPTFDVDETLAMIQHTTDMEKSITSGSSYLECFRGINRRRTEIVCMLWVTQIGVGNNWSNYSTYFFTQAGLPAETGYTVALGQYGLNTVFPFVAWAIMGCGVGRRPLFITGICCLSAVLFCIGFVGLVPDRHAEQRALATGGLMLVWAAFYQLSVGSVAFSLAAEMSTRHLALKTLSLGRMSYNVAAIVSNALVPRMLNPEAWNWKNYAGYFWGGSALLFGVYQYFRLPEPSGRTFAEMDLLFELHTPARKFKDAKIDVFDVALDAHGEKAEVMYVEDNGKDKSGGIVNVEHV